MIILNIVKVLVLAAKLHEPTIISTRLGSTSCTENSPGENCQGLLLTVENPFETGVLATFNCGYHVDNFIVDLPAKTRVDIDIATDAPQGIQSCYIQSWIKKVIRKTRRK